MLKPLKILALKALYTHSLYRYIVTEITCQNHNLKVMTPLLVQREIKALSGVISYGQK